ncbi:MAG: DUF3445 domain-containing protein [Phyllobacteriaceae bacterium]|nr:DUF3445 domain-containing protein [Phyllobacteriaceae bacterium]
MPPCPHPPPYDGTSKPFAIGLKPLDAALWLDGATPDLAGLLAEKDRLIAERPGDVFAAEGGTEAAQREALDLVAGFATAREPAAWRREGGAIAVAGRRVEIDNPAEPALQAAGRLVADDFVLMRRGDDGWRLAAASLCFPSSWVLAEKFGKPMSAIHAPVPGFAAGTRNDELIARMFDKVQPDVVVERFNWSLQGDRALYHPLPDRARDERARAAQSRFPGADPATSAVVRVERQTLRKLPLSGDMLFTIRIHLDPMAWIATRRDSGALAASMAAQLSAMTPGELAYKGLAADRDRLVSALSAMA